MRILVCVKRVPAPGAKIALEADGRAIDTANLAFTVSPHEECGVEIAVQLVEEHGGSVTVMTLGPDDADDQLRHAASVGADHLILIPGADHDWDPQATARALTDAIRDTEDDAAGPFDLIVFGNESADSGGYQVGIRVAHDLGRPMVNGVKGLEIEDGVAVAKRETDMGTEVYRLPLPAAVGVKEGVALPRYPTLKGRLASKQAEVRRHDWSGETGGLGMIRLVKPPVDTKETRLLSGPSEAADVVEELGLL